MLGADSRRTGCSGRRWACRRDRGRRDRPHPLQSTAPPTPARSSTQSASRIAILLRAPTIDEVERRSLDGGDVMPQKSTYFYPKMLDGFVFYGLDDCR